MGKPTEQGKWIDALGEFSLGMNSDPAVVALPKNQCAFATNCTFRGNFVTFRPPYQDITLTFDDASEQTYFETGKWQGCCFYQPDSDPSCIIASVGGRLFQITPNATSAKVIDITIPGDPNPAAREMAWLWQFEKFVAVNDGESQTIFFDGNSSRRSNGERVVLGTTASTFTVPAIGGTVSVPLTNTFLGNVGDIVLVNGAQYEVVPNAAATYEIILTNLRETAATLPIGTNVESHSAYVCQTAAISNIANTNNQDSLTSIPIVGPISGATGVFTYNNVRTDVAAGARQDYIGTDPPSHYSGPGASVFATDTTNISGGAITPPYNGYVEFWTQQTVSPGKNVAAGSIIRRTGSDVVLNLGTFQALYNVPAVGTSANAIVNTPYTGTDGASVWINGSQWLISKVASGPVGTTITLKNINDTRLTESGDITNIPELPPGRMGVYGLGRNWVSLTDGISYIGSDLVGGSSGTTTNQFRDAPMRTIENYYLAGGGAFRVPASGQEISAMAFPATLDSSLGQGPLQVLTPKLTFSCNAPVERLSWQDLVNPIQTQSLIGGGSVSSYSVVAINGDLWFRAIDGIRSLKLARQDFIVSYGNTPQSTEMNRVIIDDNRSLLSFCSAIVFDNRMLMTASPTQTQGGVVHTKLIALNLDPNSSLREKASPIYDGAWDGLNVLQLVTGQFSGIERAFAFTYNTDTNKIGLTEILLTKDDNRLDNGTDRIQWSFESPALYYQPDATKRQLLRLNDGELVVAKMSGAVRFDVYYRPDYSERWVPWHSWEVPEGSVYQPRMGFGQPDLKQADATTGRPYADGYSFQLKIIVTGACVVMGVNLYAVSQSEPAYAKPLPGLTPIE